MKENRLSVIVTEVGSIYEWAWNSFRDLGIQRIDQTPPHGAILSMNRLDNRFLRSEHTGIYISPETPEYLPQLSLNSTLDIANDESFHPPFGHYDFLRVSRVASILHDQGLMPVTEDSEYIAKLVLPFSGRSDIQMEIDLGLKSRVIDATVQGEILKEQLKTYYSSTSTDIADVLMLAAEKPELLKKLKQTIEAISESNRQIDIKMVQQGRPRYGVDFTDPNEVESVLKFYTNSYQALLRALYEENSVTQPDVAINFGKPVEFWEVKNHFFPDVDL